MIQSRIFFPRLFAQIVFAILLIGALALLINGWISDLMALCRDSSLVSKEAAENISEILTKVRWTTVGAGLIAVALVLWLGLWKGVQAGKQLQRIMLNLPGIQSQLNQASASLVADEQNILSSVNRQSAFIQEVVALLEEVSTSTRQNADHAARSRSLSSETRSATESCINLMQEMAAAVGQVSEASSETQNIVKAINEIAFQTNLLSLNAAVEAARAGEAGAGFAVVAGEVRNLASRSANAASETSHLIGDIGAKIDEAAEMVLTAIDEFSRVVEDHGKASDLIDEIAATTGGQKRRIDQIQGAASEFDRMTRENANRIENSVRTCEFIVELAAELKDLASRFSGKPERSVEMENDTPKSR